MPEARWRISEYEHVRCLQDQGWTVQGWERGHMDSIKERRGIGALAPVLATVVRGRRLVGL